MLPDATAADAIRSDDVSTVMSVPPDVGYPNCSPLNVKTNADADGIAAPAVVMTTDVAVVALHVPVSPATLLLPAATVGVTDARKKLDGYVSVMVSPGGTAFNGVNPIVTGTSLFPAFRSDKAMENNTFMS